MSQDEKAGTSGRPAATLTSLFSIESHMLSTRSADAYKAISKERSAAVCLWMMRHPLAQRSDVVNRFLSRITKIKEIEPKIAQVEAHGVDPTGMAYAVLPSLDGYPITGGNLAAEEAERRFIACIRLVERLHASGIICGDLCASSFWLGRGGETQFIGVMGSFDSEAAATAMLPPTETMNFIAPEQRSGGGLEPASDVFALGVLGYLLFTGSYPYPTGTSMFTAEFRTDQIKPLSAFMAAPPTWTEDVLWNCLQPKPTARYSNAGEILRAILDARNRVTDGKNTPAEVSREATLVGNKRKSGSVKAVQHRPVKNEDTSAAKPAAPVKRRKPPIMLGVFGLVFLFAVLISLYLSNRKATQDAERTKELTGLQQAAGDKKLEDTISVLKEGDANPGEREAQLDKLVNSNDPLAYDALIKSAKSAVNEQQRAQSEKAVIDRARRLGLLRASEQVRQWLRTLKPTELPEYYEAVLRSLDTTLPMDARGQALKQTYTSNPKLALRLTAALALDTGKYEDYKTVFANLLSDFTKTSGMSDHSFLALLLADPELALVYGDDVIQKRDQLPDNDVLWVLKILAERNDEAVRAIANLALERNLLSPLRKVFIGLVRDRGDLPSEVVGVLIRAAAGGITRADIGTLGAWYDIDSERVLLAAMADTTDKDTLTEAFDTLAGKSLTLEPSEALIDWVRHNHWDDRATFAHSIGLIAYADVLGADALDKGFAVFDHYAEQRGFMDIFLKGNSPQLIRVVVHRYSDKIGVGGLINLLGSPDKDVRMIAIKGLKDVNEIAILKLIIDKYEREKDPEVKKMYLDTFWVIKEREQKL